MSRFLALCITLVLAFVPIAARSQTTNESQKATIVLLHGAWADASSFNAVIGRLQKAGYTVYAPPMSATQTR